MMPSSPTPSSASESAILDALDSDSDPALAPYRAQRIQQLHSEFAREKQLRAESQESESVHGRYSEILDEKALMEIVTGTKCCVVHFFKTGFKRCGVMDGHLEALAPVHLTSRFLRMNVENAPFLVTKLKIQVLPCVVAFVDGVSVDRIVGFEGLGFGEDDFKTKDLEGRLLAAGVLFRAKTIKEDQRNRIQDDDENDDWD